MKTIIFLVLATFIIGCDNYKLERALLSYKDTLVEKWTIPDNCVRELPLTHKDAKMSNIESIFPRHILE